jgi:hypothetical protein
LIADAAQIHKKLIWDAHPIPAAHFARLGYGYGALGMTKYFAVDVEHQSSGRNNLPDFDFIFLADSTQPFSMMEIPLHRDLLTRMFHPTSEGSVQSVPRKFFQNSTEAFTC